MMSEADVETIKSNRCPACGNWGFIPGPRGGAGQNIYCCNPECRASYMVAPRSTIMLAQRVGTAPDSHYPPRVHILDRGQPLCGFAGYRWIDEGPPPSFEPIFPVDWPIGHSWIGRDGFEFCTCTACRERAQQ